jgi:succinate dehydrogenase / fumarate reductase flavoprotein subunit/L-aspartate oxidase
VTFKALIPFIGAWIKENTMAYTPEMKELIKKVEATRPARVAMARRNENYPALSMAERAEVLSNFHPD